MPEHHLLAVSAALALQSRNQELNMLRRSEGKPEVHVGIGIDSGDVIAGYIGSPMRMDYTVVGDRVNTAKRFCDLAEAGKVVVGESVWQVLKDKVQSRRWVPFCSRTKNSRCMPRDSGAQVIPALTRKPLS